MALLNRASIVKMRFLLITTIIYVFNITFAQNIQYGKIYKSAKIFFENGQRIEVKNLEFLNNTTVTYDNAITNQQLSEISQIQAKKGTASKGGIICGGACGLFMIVSALGGVFSSYEYEEYNNETNQNETKTEPGLSAGEVIVSTAIFAGISYGIGWLSGYIFDDWEVIYANQKLGMSKRDGWETSVKAKLKTRDLKSYSQENLDQQELQYLYKNLPEYETNVKGTPILAKPGLVGYLHGFAGDGKPQHGYGLSYYTGIWSTFEKYQLEGYQRGHGTWITPDNSGYELPLCPEGTTARDNWPERAPSYRDVFQTIEGGPGYWGNTVFPDPQMKYRVNAVTDCYTTQTSSPGWNWGGNDNLNEQPGLAQLSNKLLYAPDGITFEREANGDFLGQCWMALPLTSTILTSSTIGTNNWTLFLNAANFSGPTVYMTPEGWNRITNGYPPAKGRGLDVLFTNSIYRPLADEIGSIQSYVSQFDGQTFIQIPKMKYPVDQNGRTIFHQDVKFYSSKAIYDDINSHLQTGSPLTSRALDAQGAITTKLGSTHFGFKLGGKEIRGLKKIVETQTFNGNAWGFKWNDENSSGIFPQYYLDAGDYQTVVPAEDVPKETRFIDGNRGWRPAVQTRSYEPPPTGWPEPEGGKTYTATLIDGSIITYGWYRFVDQPAIKKLKLNSDQQAILQSVVEAIHSIDWGVSNPVLSPPTHGSLIEIDNALIVTPPDGMGIGYVPVALTQSMK